MAYDCGAVNRLEPESLFLGRLEIALHGFPETVLDKINRELNKLTPQQIETIGIGETDDCAELLKSLEFGNEIDEFFNEIFAIC